MKHNKVLMISERVKDGKELNIKINIPLSEIENSLSILNKEVQKPEANFESLKNTSLELVSCLPFPIYQFSESFILRSRPNFNGEVFSKKSEISYNPCLEKISLNRFNLPGEPAFYGAVPIKDDNTSGALTTICESYKDLLDNNSIIKSQYLTIGKWNVIKPIPLVVLTFYEVALKKNSHIQNINPVYAEFMGLSCNEEDSKKCQLVYNYFSESAGKKIDTPNNYLLTTAFYHALQEQYGKEIGILYSSSGTSNNGLNIVLTKEIIDGNYLELNHVVMYKCQRDPSNFKSFNIYPCSSGSDVNAKGEFQLIGII